jgi:anti-sigma factor RsiW
VFIYPERGEADRRVSSRSIRGFHVRQWSHGGMSWWAVSDLNDAELNEFVNLLQQP